MMLHARPLGGRSMRGVLAVAAVFALLQPLLTPLAPALAGWIPGHQHIYVNGTPRQHAHPWDEEAPPTIPAGYVFHLCAIHPDGLVPIDTSSAFADTPEVPEQLPIAEFHSDVLFTFDLGVTIGAIPKPAAQFSISGGVFVGSSTRAEVSISDPLAPPAPPPPRL